MPLHEGVSCEACHGAGSGHADEAAKRKGSEPLAIRLPKTTEQTCAACHANAHGKPFDYAAAVAAIAHPKVPPEIKAEPRYKTPLNLALRPDGRELYVTCEAAHSVIVVDTATRRKVAEIPVGGQPMDVTFSPDGRRAFVSNRLDDSRLGDRRGQRKVVATIPVGDEPHGVLTDRAGKYLYVLNTATEDISVIDTATLDGGQAAVGQPRPLGAGAVARRSADLRHEHVFAFRGTAHAVDFRGDGDRHGAGGGRRPADPAGDESPARRGLASQRQVRPGHACCGPRTSSP